MADRASASTTAKEAPGSSGSSEALIAKELIGRDLTEPICCAELVARRNVLMRLAANFHGSSIVEFVLIVTKVIRIFICIRAQIGYQGRMRNPGNQTKTGQLINVVRIN